MDAITITIEGKEWALTRPTDGQLTGLFMMTSDAVDKETRGALALDLILGLIQPEAHRAFITEFLTGGYTPEHIEVVIRQIIAAFDDKPDTASVPVPRKTTARKPRKTAARKTVR
jgi:hypothetical protein